MFKFALLYFASYYHSMNKLSKSSSFYVRLYKLSTFFFFLLLKFGVNHLCYGNLLNLSGGSNFLNWWFSLFSYFRKTLLLRILNEGSFCSK